MSNFFNNAQHHSIGFYFDLDLIKNQLYEAERSKNYKIELFVSRNSDDRFLGQIFHYRPTELEKKVGNYPKNIWTITKISGQNIILEITKENYLPEGRKIDNTDIYTEILTKTKNNYFVGKIVIGISNKNGEYYNNKLGIILGSTKTTIRNEELSFKSCINNPHKEIIYDEVSAIKIGLETEDNRIKNNQYDINKLQTKIIPIDVFVECFIICQQKNVEEYLKTVKFIEENPDLELAKKNKLIGDVSQSDYSENSLVVTSSTQPLKNYNESLELQQQNIESLIAGSKRNHEIIKKELEIRMREEYSKMDLIRQNLEIQVKKFKKEIEKVYRLIASLEIYLGVKENVIQIRSGENAQHNEIINLRQSILYMDEESLIDYENGGMDFHNIEDFDSWITTNNNFKKLIPEEKCIVLLRPRRYMKDRKNIHPFLRDKLENEDKKVYFLIRNGDNLYRIWTENIEFLDRLFPLKTEFLELTTTLAEIDNPNKEKEIVKYGRNTESEKEELKDKINNLYYYYKRTFLLLQGIITRTEIFVPVDYEINLMKPESYVGKVNFIYDDENIIDDGRLPFSEWRKQINHNIKKGSKVFVSFKNSRTQSTNDIKERLSLYWEHDNSAPPLPEEGIYELHEFKKEVKETIYKELTQEEYDSLKESYKIMEIKYGEWKKIPDEELLKIPYNIFEEKTYWKNNNIEEKFYKVPVLETNFSKTHYNRLGRKNETELKTITELKFSYKPNDTVYARRQSFDDGSWSRERKGTITFKVLPTDDFILNYDSLTQDYLDYFINNRRERRNYLSILPLLMLLRKQLEKEKIEEEDFSKMLINNLFSTYGINKDLIKDLVLKSIHWWKKESPVVYTRFIDDDNKKAKEMITKKVLSEINKITKSSFSIANNKRVLIFNDGNNKFGCYGLFKKEFVKQLKDKYYPLMKNYSENKMNDLISSIDKNENKLLFEQLCKTEKEIIKL
jgi:hypothetical protein